MASYGKQFGRIEDALLMLFAHFRPERPLTDEAKAVIDDLKAVIAEVAAVKVKHRQRAAA